MERSGAQNGLRAMSIIIIIMAIITFITGIILVSTFGYFVYDDAGQYVEGSPDVVELANEGGMTGDQAVTVIEGAGLGYGIMNIVLGIYYFIVGCLGIRGANNPRKVGAFTMLSFIGLICSIVAVFASAIQLNWTALITNLIDLIFIALAWKLASNVRRQVRD